MSSIKILKCKTKEQRLIMRENLNRIIEEIRENDPKFKLRTSKRVLLQECKGKGPYMIYSNGELVGSFLLKTLGRNTDHKFKELYRCITIDGVVDNITNRVIEHVKSGMLNGHVGLLFFCNNPTQEEIDYYREQEIVSYSSDEESGKVWFCYIKPEFRDEYDVQY
ncbi:MAG: hypothetical protein ACRC92_20355 [Peptostreptococcaceae bacterium]